MIPLEVLRQRYHSKIALISVGLLIVSIAIFIPFFIKSHTHKKIIEPQQRTSEDNLEPQAQVMFSTDIKSENNINFVSIKQQKVYFTVSLLGNFSNFQSRKNHGVCKIFDSQGTLAAIGESYLSPEVSILNTRCWYNFKNDDKPGNWKFEFYFDGKKIAQKSLKVLP